MEAVVHMGLVDLMKQEEVDLMGEVDLMEEVDHMEEVALTIMVDMEVALGPVTVEAQNVEVPMEAVIHMAQVDHMSLEVVVLMEEAGPMEHMVDCLAIPEVTTRI